MTLPAAPIRGGEDGDSRARTVTKRRPGEGRASPRAELVEPASLSGPRPLCGPAPILGPGPAPSRSAPPSLDSGLWHLPSPLPRAPLGSPGDRSPGSHGPAAGQNLGVTSASLTQLLVPGMTFPGAFSRPESGPQPSVSITHGLPSSRTVELKIMSQICICSSLLPVGLVLLTPGASCRAS